MDAKEAALRAIFEDFMRKELTPFAVFLNVVALISIDFELAP